MPYIIIACIILLVGAAAEITAYVFTAKLLKKKEDGLNRRKDAIGKKEGVLDSREIQLDRRESEIAEREKVLPQGILPGDRLEVVTANRQIRKIAASAIMDVDVFMGSYGSFGISSCQPFISECTERVKDELRDEICKGVRELISFFMCDDVRRGKREVVAELWVAEGGPDDGVS